VRYNPFYELIEERVLDWFEPMKEHHR